MPSEAYHPTKHEQVRSHILERVAAGEIQPGDSLPGELELAEQLHVSRNTIRHALGQLATEGRIERTRRRGTVYVGERDTSTDVKTIGIVNSSQSHSIYPELLHGIEDGLYHGGYTMILANGNYDHKKERDSIARMLDQGIAGLIIEPHLNSRLEPTDEFFKLLDHLKIPIVTTNCVISGLRGSAITVDDHRIGQRATDYLIGRGHRRIACIYKSDAQAGMLRLDGYRDALSAAGIPFDEKLVRSYDETFMPKAPGAELTKQILDSVSIPPTAFFYFNDEIVLQAYAFFESRGMRIPEDVSLIAVDNVRESSILIPALTTFNHPKYVMGKLAAELMFAHLNPFAYHAGYVVRMELDLIERGSVADLG
jgi:GntR family transcriptional regulator, arabinose operon transcriptional repressor